MANKINMRLPKEQVLHADVEFAIFKSGSSGQEKLGELHISKGNVEWWPAGNRTKKYRIRWSKLGEVFEKEEFLVKKKK